MLSRNGQPAFGLGDFLGSPSLEDLRNLIYAKDYELNQIYKHYLSFEPVWKAQDVPAQQDWANDWNALIARFKQAKTEVQWIFTASKFTPTPDSMIIAENEWNVIIRSLRKNWDGKTGGQLAKGDEADLEYRLQGASKVSSDFSNEPQPQGDVDLAIFKAADKATRGIEAVASKIVNYVPVGLAIGAGVLVLIGGAYLLIVLRPK
jgi:hypothetical protein